MQIYLRNCRSPREAVDARGELYWLQHLVAGYVEDLDGSCRRAAHKRKFAVGREQKFAEGRRDVERFFNFRAGEIDDEDFSGWRRGEEFAAVRGWRGRIHGRGDGNPTGDFIGRGVDYGDAGRVLIVSEDALAVGGNGNALDSFRDGDYGDETALLEVENADAAGGHIGGISAPTVGRNDDHVGFARACWDLRDHFTRGGIDDVDRFIELGGDIEHAVGAELGAVRTKRLAKVDRADEFVFA